MSLTLLLSSHCNNVARHRYRKQKKSFWLTVVECRAPDHHSFTKTYQSIGISLYFFLRSIDQWDIFEHGIFYVREFQILKQFFRSEFGYYPNCFKMLLFMNLKFYIKLECIISYFTCNVKNENYFWIYALIFKIILEAS